MTINPISAFTGATTDVILDDPLVRGFVSSVMLEAKAIGERIGIPIAQTPEDRHAVTRKLGAFRTSMLQDVDAGKPVELDALVASVRADPVAAPDAPASAAAPRRVFVLRDGLLYRRSSRGDRLCIPAAGDLRRTVLQELHATPLGGHFGRDKTLGLARRSVWWPGMPAALTDYVRTCPTCQRVKADHLPPAGLLFPLPVPSRRGGCISLDFLELPAARSGHDFLQVHIDLLTGRVWLVPTFKTATAETAAHNYVGSVFRDVGLPDVLVSDRDTRFTSAFWTALHAALGSSLIFGSPHHHNTTSKVERVNGVIADVLRAFAGDRGDDWPEFVPLAEFAINDSVSTLGSGYTPFYADRGQHPRRPLTPPAPPPPAPACPAAASGRGKTRVHAGSRRT
jgi:hypothetical protein